MQKQRDKIIKRADMSDLNDVLHIYQSCADWLLQKGLDHWKEWYTEKRLKDYINEKEAYLIKRGGTAVGAIFLSTEPPPYYYKHKPLWKNGSAMAIYMSGLGILPSHHGKGLAVKLLNFAEETAKEKGASYVRFDTWALDGRLVEFYQKGGYTFLGRDGTNNFFEKQL